MMPNFSRNLLQTATYWVLNTRTLYGNGAYAAPVPLLCRWEDCNELVIDKHGVEVKSSAKVFFAQDISLEGYLLLGTSNAPDPTVVNEAREVIQVKRTPDLRNLQNLYVVFLK